MEISATSKYIHVSTRKMLLLAGGVKKMSPQSAVSKLEHINKSAALPLKKVIASAISNAQTKNVSVDNLQFKSIVVTAGPAMKRFRAVSRGMAHAYKKRMSHVTVVLTDEKKNNKKTDVSRVKKGAKS